MLGSNKPLNFVQGLETGQHVVLFYEDKKYAERIQFKFLNEGLQKGESCVITTHRSVESLRTRMTREGVEVEHYAKDGLLHVMKIQDPMTHPRGVSRGVTEVYDQIFSVLEEPFRIVSTTFKDIGASEVYRREIQLERKAQKTLDGGDPDTKRKVFHDMEGIVMCTYQVNEFPEGNTRWLPTLSSAHHAAIFAPRKKEGFAMMMRPVGGEKAARVAG